jgi:D-alanyl-D-alanine carboxypeptidase/D-alanyl-D-alanine-endopeptidase (penicillin-binding protein 4)
MPDPRLPLRKTSTLRSNSPNFRPFRTVGLLLLAALAAPGVWGAEAKQTSRRPSLAHQIESILRRSEARRGHWGIEVVRLRDGKVLYTRDADRLYLPASNMKLFTTAAALEKLGANFVFHTTVEAEDAPGAEGRVQDLFLVGRGDPNLGNRVLPGLLSPASEEPADAIFRKLAEQVVARGVREVAGNLVADDSYFLFEPYSHGWDEEDLQWGYGAPVTALAFNDNALLLRVQPAAKVGERAEVRLEPIADYYQLNNRLETGAAGGQKQIYVERPPGSRRLDVWGEIPLDAGEDQDSVSIANPPELMGESFRGALEAQGIAVRGHVEVRHLTRLEAATSADPFPKPAPRVVLAEHVSEPLAADIKIINKVSHNLHVEMLLRTLGHEVENYGSLTVGLEVLQEFAARVGVQPEAVKFSDASGLSRQDLVAPHAIIKLLEYMAASPRFKIFLDSLPVAGEDGTLANRFRGPPARGRIHAKTGTMEHTNTLSGYMDLPSGERLAFSILGNNHPLKSAEGAAVLDRIALEIYRHFAGRPRKR